ncbi:MAG: hypothetical protein K0S70_1092 [Microbacterium sp.]|jgi:hypothetical protein|nr:hypothetical protein [Microbacterium sp.]
MPSHRAARPRKPGERRPRSNDSRVEHRRLSHPDRAGHRRRARRRLEVCLRRLESQPGSAEQRAGAVTPPFTPPTRARAGEGPSCHTTSTSNNALAAHAREPWQLTSCPTDIDAHRRSHCPCVRGPQLHRRQRRRRLTPVLVITLKPPTLATTGVLEVGHFRRSPSSRLPAAVYGHLPWPRGRGEARSPLGRTPSMASATHHIQTRSASDAD